MGLLADGRNGLVPSLALEFSQWSHFKLLNFLTRNARSSAPLEEAVNALSWAHKLAVVDNPTEHSPVRQVLAGAKRLLAHQTSKKEPVTADILQKLHDKFVTSETGLPVMRTMAI